MSGAPADALPRLADVERAAITIAGRVARTPTLRVDDAELGGRIAVKAELLQLTGSFKVRGAITRVAALTPEERARGVIAVSAGNHARAVAHACAEAGVDCLVVMWQGASETKIAATRALGALVDLEAAGPTGAFPRMEELRTASGRVLVHPFADPLVLAGAGTVALELAADVPDLATVIVPAGGGGLVSGIACALAELRPEVRIVAVEPAVSNALGAGLAAGEPVPVTPTSIADGLNAPFTTEPCIAACRRAGVETVTVSEQAIEEAFRRVYRRLKLATEPAGAVGVAALLEHPALSAARGTTATVVTGGNVDATTASAILSGR